MEMNILLRLLTAYLLSDLLLQPAIWVKSKETKKAGSAFLYLQALLVTAVTYLFFWDWQKWYVPLIIGFAHLLTDIWKCYLKKTFISFLIAQLLHVTAIIIIWLIFYFNLNEIKLKIIDISHDNHIWLILLGYYTVIWPLGAAIGKATEKWQKAACMDADGLDKAGMWIGRCERILIFTFIITTQYTALGFLMAAKSILRFTDKDSMTQKKTEYVLVGTFISFASASVTGIVIAALLK